MTDLWWLIRVFAQRFATALIWTLMQGLSSGLHRISQIKAEFLHGWQTTRCDSENFIDQKGITNISNAHLLIMCRGLYEALQDSFQVYKTLHSVAINLIKLKSIYYIANDKIYSCRLRLAEGMNPNVANVYTSAIIEADDLPQQLQHFISVNFVVLYHVVVYLQRQLTPLKTSLVKSQVEKKKPSKPTISLTSKVPVFVKV